MPSLFRRKTTDTVDEAPTEAPADSSQPGRPRGYTPSKKELGVVTPKRPTASTRRAAEPPPANRREAYQRMRERQRTDRAEQREGMMRGDDQYLLARDRGPERALVRDIVDSRRTVGPFFFGTAFLVLFSSVFKNQQAVLVGLIANAVWGLFLLATVVDSVLIARRIKRLVQERFPRTDQRLGSLYLYGIMRAISFRRLRVPKPRVAIGAKI